MCYINLVTSHSRRELRSSKTSITSTDEKRLIATHQWMVLIYIYIYTNIYIYTYIYIYLSLSLLICAIIIFIIIVFWSFFVTNKNIKFYCLYLLCANSIHV